MNKLSGYRGYIGSRVYQCGEFPQFVQNMVIRNYCQKHKLAYLLSATEYAMSGCYMVLQEVVDSIRLVDGIVLFSIFMLPEVAESRFRIYEKVLLSGKTLHTALEDLSLKSLNDIRAVEVVLNVNRIVMNHTTISTLLSHFVNDDVLKDRQISSNIGS